MKPQDNSTNICSVSKSRFPRSAWIETSNWLEDDIGLSKSRFPRSAWIETRVQRAPQYVGKSRFPRSAWIETIAATLPITVVYSRASPGARGLKHLLPALQGFGQVALPPERVD